jgi:hypothetical protein
MASDSWRTLPADCRGAAAKVAAALTIRPETAALVREALDDIGRTVLEAPEDGLPLASGRTKLPGPAGTRSRGRA